MVETARLQIIPLTLAQLTKYLRAENRLEDELALTRTDRVISDDVKEMVEQFTLPKMKGVTMHDYLFYTFWIVINKSTRIIVAELGFKGPPGRIGTIEIGYGTMPGHRRNGYMTEAVAGMIDWALARKDVNTILAETDQHNTASIRIVHKNGFTQFDKRGEMLWWRRDVAGLL